jgi:alcohol dehydrogenase
MDKSLVDAVAERISSRDRITQAFDLSSPTRIVYGPGTIDSLGKLAQELGVQRALVVSDTGIVAAGHTGRGVAALEAASLEVEVFADIHENPTTDDVARGLEVATGYQPDVLIGIGGGSSMDCAKGINFLLTGGGRMQDYWGVGKATEPMLPMIAVPTTAGTGSEAQSFALISDAETHVKMACGDKKAAFRIAVLDPQLTLTMPHQVTAVTGIDAVAHAVETAVTSKRSAISEIYSRAAWVLLADNFRRVFEEPGDLESRAGMQLGACLAGMAIENSMLGAAHALANPLTAHYGLVHGQAVGLMLPHVVRYNSDEVDSLYDGLLQALRAQTGMEVAGEGGAGLADYLTGLLQAAELKTRLGECGVEFGKLPELAVDAAKQWTGTFNPRPVDETTLLEIYNHAF